MKEVETPLISTRSTERFRTLKLLFVGLAIFFIVAIVRRKGFEKENALGTNLNQVEKAVGPRYNDMHDMQDRGWRDEDDEGEQDDEEEDDPEQRRLDKFYRHQALRMSEMPEDGVKPNLRRAKSMPLPASPSVTQAQASSFEEDRSDVFRAMEEQERRQNFPLENKDSLSHAVDFESDRADGYRALEALNLEQSRGGRRGSKRKQPKLKKPSIPDENPPPNLINLMSEEHEVEPTSCFLRNGEAFAKCGSAVKFQWIEMIASEEHDEEEEHDEDDEEEGFEDDEIAVNAIFGSDTQEYPDKWMETDSNGQNYDWNLFVCRFNDEVDCKAYTCCEWRG